jgi:hypothetical protein
MTRKRKPLDESLATDFVYGTNEPLQEVEKIEPSSPPAKTIAESSTLAIAENTPTKTIAPESMPTPKQSLMEKLQIKAKEATTRFTVDLPDSMHRKLSILAAKTGRTKAEIVRMVLDEALKDVDE